MRLGASDSVWYLPSTAFRPILDCHMGPGHFNEEGWKHILDCHGGMLPISIKALNASKRPVSAVADQKEIRNVASIDVKIAHECDLTLLFDRGHSLDERIVGEQFMI